MKILYWLVGTLVGLFIVVMAMQMAASESGEVVVLTTKDTAGAAHTTRAWVVDYDGAAWLRAGSAHAGWFARLQTQPVISVERAGTTAAYRAVPVPDATPEINRLMAEKYGWADRFIGMMISRTNAVAIRLEPVAS